MSSEPALYAVVIAAKDDAILREDCLRKISKEYGNFCQMKSLISCTGPLRSGPTFSGNGFYLKQEAARLDEFEERLGSHIETNLLELLYLISWSPWLCPRRAIWRSWTPTSAHIRKSRSPRLRRRRSPLRSVRAAEEVEKELAGKVGPSKRGRHRRRRPRCRSSSSPSLRSNPNWASRGQQQAPPAHGASLCASGDRPGPAPAAHRTRLRLHAEKDVPKIGWCRRRGPTLHCVSRWSDSAIAPTESPGKR